MLSEPPPRTVFGLAVLGGKALQKWRRHDEVHNLNRELKKELRADHRVPAADRDPLRDQVDKWLIDPTFLDGIRSYVEDADVTPLTAIRKRLSELIKLSNPDDVPAVADVVVETIERCVTRAKKTDRRAAYHQTRVSEQRVIERMDRAHASLAEQGARQEAKIDELLERARGGALSQVEPGLAAPADEDDGSPEGALQQLAKKDEEAAARLRAAWQSEDDELVALVHDRTSWLYEAQADVWEAAGRLLFDAGAFGPAEQAYIAAAERGHTDAIRQLARASTSAAVRGDEARAAQLLTMARETEGGEDHPAVALREIERLTDDPAEMRRRIALVEPTSPREEAIAETLLGQSYLIDGEYELALAATERAIALDDTHAGAYELRALAHFLPEQERYAAGEPVDRERLDAARADFARVRDLTREAQRFRESAQMVARLAEVHFVGDDPGAAAATLQPPELLDEEREAGARQLAHAALLLGQPELAEELLPDDDESDETRVFRLSARARGESTEDALSAVVELRELLDGSDAGVAKYAALSLLFAAARHREVPWDEPAAEMLDDGPAAMLPVLRSDALRVQGDLEGAENELLKLSDDAGAAHALVSLAAAREDWATAKLRTDALLRIEDTGRNRLLRAEILRSSDERDEALAELDRIARDNRNSVALRAAAYHRAGQIAGERRDWSAMDRLVQDWRQLGPTDEQACWFHTLALARLARHEEALALWEVGLLTVSTRDQALLLAEVLLRAADATTGVREISALSEQFGCNDERLEFLVLMAALRRNEPLPQDLEQRVREGFERFPKKFPESRMLWAEPAPTTPEEFDAFAGKFASSEADLTRDFREKIVSGEAPVASLAAAAGKDISTIWGRLGFLPLGYSDETLDELERGDAAQAIGRPAVWDPTSLLVVGGLEDSIRDRIRTALIGSLISNSTLEETDHAATEVGGERGGEVGYDHQADRGYFVEHGPELVEQEHGRAASALELAKALEATFDADPDDQERWAQLLARDNDLHRQLATWFSTMAVAHRRGLPVYSDDRFIRMAARREGVSAFGTLALIDALTDREILSEDERRAVRRSLLRAGGSGVRATPTELIDAADEASWGDVPELAVALHDRSAWANDTVQTWYRAADVLAASFDAAPERLEAWLHRTLDAAAIGRPGVSATQHVHSLLVSCWDFLDYPPKYPDRFFHRVLWLVKNLPLPLRPWPPIDIPLYTMASIMETATQLDDENRRTIFWRMWRRLPALDQARAFLAFVALPPAPRQIHELPAPAKRAPRRKRRSKRKR